MPFISVIIPVYNVKNYLKRCVESLLQQKYNYCEIILVDDGSDDGSSDICDLLAKENRNVFAFHKVNGGLASARNYGLEYVNGRYVTFVDADDWVTCDYFETIDKYLRENESDILKFGYQNIQDNKPGLVTTPFFDEGVYEKESIEKDILPGVIGPICLFDYSRTALMSACTSAYAVAFLNENNIRFQSEREILSEDHLFNYKALLRASRIGISHKVLYMYDFREGSLTKRYIINMVRRKQSLLGVYKQELEKCKILKKYESIYYSQCVDGYYACIINECSQWVSDNKKNNRRKVKDILELDECQSALKKCKTDNMKLKGWIIYWLMRTKQADLMCILYRMIKKIK